MPEATKMPSIPVPVKDNLDSRFDCIMALKQAVEILMGTRGDQAVVRTFIQESTPDAFVNGDLWFKPSSARLSTWDGKGWRLIAGGP